MLHVSVYETQWKTKLCSQTLSYNLIPNFQKECFSWTAALEQAGVLPASQTELLPLTPTVGSPTEGTVRSGCDTHCPHLSEDKLMCGCA